uniref:Uncharacterized protein n=1 Tax=Anopheles farauti TaxID=69004 RepID=A0A182QLB4_9DIPT
MLWEGIAIAQRYGVPGEASSVSAHGAGNRLLGENGMKRVENLIRPSRPGPCCIPVVHRPSRDTDDGNEGLFGLGTVLHMNRMENPPVTGQGAHCDEFDCATRNRHDSGPHMYVPIAKRWSSACHATGSRDRQQRMGATLRTVAGFLTTQPAASSRQAGRQGSKHELGHDRGRELLASAPPPSPSIQLPFGVVKLTVIIIIITTTTTTMIITAGRT